MTLDNNWFTEKDTPYGSAFSLHLDSKLHEEQTPFQKIAIYKTTEFGHLMVIDDFIMLSERDNFIYHEMMAHPILFTHPNPQRIAIIGGGDCGTLREVLKHQQVQQVTQVDIDERVTRLAEQYFPSLCEFNQDPRVTLHFSDGIQWMAEASEKCLDVIIVDSTDPVGPGEGLFDVAFYQNCRRALKADGLLVQQSESPLLHLTLLKSMHQAMQTAGFQTTRTLQFPLCVYPSGWWTATLAGNSDLTNFRLVAVENKTFPTYYYNAEVHRASFALPNFLQEAFGTLG